MKQPKAVKVDKPDGSLAWQVAFAACLINFIMEGFGRMSGILYVGFIEMFGISRGQAMAPFSIKSSMRNLLGPVVGILGQEYGVRAVSLIGGVIGVVSSASCFFAPDINWITFIWGGINGAGTALTTTLPQVTIGQYFKKYHTTAVGLAFSGGCFGAFMFPALIEYLLHQFGLYGTFLLMAGITMHVIPAAMILRKPPWMRGKNKELSVSADETQSAPKIDANEKINGTIKINGHTNENGFTKINHVAIESSQSVLNVDKGAGENSSCLVDKNIFFHNNQNLFSHTLWHAVKFQRSNSSYFSHDCLSLKDTKLNTIPSEALVLNFLYRLYNNTQNQSTVDSSDVCNKQNGCTDVKQSENLNNIIENTLMEFKKEQVMEEFLLYMKNTDSVFLQMQTSARLRFIVLAVADRVESRKLLTDDCSVIVNVESTSNIADTKSSNPIKNRGFIKHIKAAIKLNSNPIFHIICLCRTIHFITFIPVVTVVVDFGMDKGLPEEDGKYIIAALSAGDLIGRLGLGWITDGGYIVLPKYMLLGMVIQGVTTATLPLIDVEWAFFLAIVIFGMLQGSLFIRHPVLVSIYMHPDEQPIAMGCINFLSGFVGFGLPAYIGYFRDTLGSYDHMFHITGALGTVAGLLWIFEPQFARWIPKKHRTDSVQER